MSEDRPLLDTVLEMTAASVTRTSLNDRELMIARVAALTAIGAQPASYLLNLAAASDVGLTLEDAQGSLVAIAPIVGTARTVSAATAIAEALGLAVAIEDAIEESQVSA